MNAQIPPKKNTVAIARQSLLCVTLSPYAPRMMNGIAYPDQDGRVNLLILGDRHELGGVLEFLRNLSVVHLCRRLSEPCLDLLGALQRPAACLLNLNIGSLDLGLDHFFDRFRLLLGYPRVDHEGVLAGRDPYRDLSLLDLDGKLFLGCLKEVLVFDKKKLDFFVRALEFRLSGGDLTVNNRKGVGCGSRHALRHLDLGETVLGERRRDLVPVSDFGEHSDDVVPLLLEGGEDFAVDSLEGSRRVVNNGSDEKMVL